MELLTMVKNKLRYEYDKQRWKRNIQAAENSDAWQRVAGMDQTLEKLLTTDCSMCRYGDGEYKVMAGTYNGFQRADPALAQRLQQVLKSDAPGLMVCIPNIQEDMTLRTPLARKFWEDFIRDFGGSFAGMLADRQYYNAHVTRLYMDYHDAQRSGAWFSKLQRVWQGKDLLIVEGEQTRLGVGNDLFAHAGTVRRIICPGKSAFSAYENILNTVKSQWRGELVLIALGQTATVLAHDLHCGGIRALDIGHIDIEYEWFLAGAKTKTAVAGKFVKEVDDQLAATGEDPVYLSQIAARVGV